MSDTNVLMDTFGELFHTVRDVIIRFIQSWPLLFDLVQCCDLYEFLVVLILNLYTTYLVPFMAILLFTIRIWLHYLPY